MASLPPFPVDDATLEMLEAAIYPWDHGDPDAERSSLWDFLMLMSEMGGPDPSAIAHENGDQRVVVNRYPMYTDHCVITALIAEVRRLRRSTS